MSDLFGERERFIKCISLWQPWATGIAVGLKTVETRHWTTKRRGLIAIHAARRWGPDQREFASVEHALGRLPKRIPFGAIIAIAEITGVLPTVELAPQVLPIERIYGNYGPGRFGWLLANVKALDEPIPVAGRQGFFNVPASLFPTGFLPQVQP